MDDKEKRKLEWELRRIELRLALIFEILASWAESEGLSLLSSQQLHSPSAQRNEKVRMLLQEIRKLGELSFFDQDV